MDEQQHIKQQMRRVSYVLVLNVDACSNCVQLPKRNVVYAECQTALGVQNYSIRSKSFAFKMWSKLFLWKSVASLLGRMSTKQILGEGVDRSKIALKIQYIQTMPSNLSHNRRIGWKSIIVEYKCGVVRPNGVKSSVTYEWQRRTTENDWKHQQPYRQSSKNRKNNKCK